MKPSVSLPFGAALFALAAACDPPPAPPKAPRHEPEAREAKCESLAEKCKAKSQTLAHLPRLGYTIVPPKGWLYAHEADVTLAEQGASGAVIAATTFDEPKASWELKKARIDAIDALAKRIGVRLAQKDVIDFHIRDVDDKLELEGHKLSIWEQEGASRDKTQGNVVVVVGTVDKREVLMLAFAPKGDDADYPALVEAIKSFKKASDGKDAHSKAGDGKGEHSGHGKSDDAKAKRP